MGHILPHLRLALYATLGVFFSSGWEAEGYMCYALISYDAWILFYLFPGCMCAGTIGMILWRGG